MRKKQPRSITGENREPSPPDRRQKKRLIVSILHVRHRHASAANPASHLHRRFRGSRAFSKTSAPLLLIASGTKQASYAQRGKAARKDAARRAAHMHQQGKMQQQLIPG
ncbi:hypothetical protein Nepgr_022983 [Nepenthes gracilis]|uniref:Uncharacterized protein n=1 Tax=Nepenthes gracilis TaxID=150966 RepID=A0AAD3T3I4_NEPGR|nr:hypothetical protein Nepgr_022983 [Nepenthes gracilis]